VPGKTNGNMKAVGGRSKRESFKREESKRAEVIPGQTVGTHRPDREEGEWDTATRNKRSVWTVATQPYSGAHFATFPPALIEPCILAGSRPGDAVLDPFFGSGTTGMVAQNLGRCWLGCELNPAYKPLQDERLQQPGLMLEYA
jgi:DNA modification methylase